MSWDGFQDVYRGKRVLVTGDTGFKGCWLALWLRALGAEVSGLALPPDTDPSLFVQTGLAGEVAHRDGDVRDPEVVRAAIEAVRPEVVFHLAAQAIVRESYRTPVETLATNVMGTAHLLDALRVAGRPCAVVVVTTDKCYENDESGRPYAESDPLGGHDLYSASKACAELVSASFRRAFFAQDGGVALATARAGNVIGAGDWAADRIVPDCVRAIAADQPVPVRNPGAVRPWQHVLEPLSGYLWLGARLLSDAAADHCEAWNFGPDPDASRPVKDLVDALLRAWGAGSWDPRTDAQAPHEAGLLKLNSDKARDRLGWRPVWDFAATVERTAAGYRSLQDARDPAAARSLLLDDVRAFTTAARAQGLPWAEGQVPA